MMNLRWLKCKALVVKQPFISRRPYAFQMTKKETRMNPLKVSTTSLRKKRDRYNLNKPFQFHFSFIGWPKAVARSFRLCLQWERLKFKTNLIKECYRL